MLAIPWPIGVPSVGGPTPSSVTRRQTSAPTVASTSTRMCVAGDVAQRLTQVLKQVRSSDLVDAVRRVAGGQSLLDPVVTAWVLERLRTGPDQDPRIARLSAQERHVLDLLAEGLTNRQIGQRLYLAEKTVKNYVTSVLSKMGMTRRTEAAVYAARHLDPPPPTTS